MDFPTEAVKVKQKTHNCVQTMQDHETIKVTRHKTIEMQMVIFACLI